MGLNISVNKISVLRAENKLSIQDVVGISFFVAPSRPSPHILVFSGVHVSR
jgi:hypothetical protein